jgi:hypothetical protein
MSQAGTPQPGYDPKPGGVPPLNPQNPDEGPHPSIPEDDDPQIEETEEQPS